MSSASHAWSHGGASVTTRSPESAATTRSATHAAGLPSLASASLLMPWTASESALQSVQSGSGRMRWLSPAPSSPTHPISMG